MKPLLLLLCGLSGLLSLATAAAPQRIIALAPHITEMLFAIGAGDKVVAVSDYSDYPPEATTLPSVASYAAVNIEAVLALRPDLVTYPLPQFAGEAAVPSSVDLFINGYKSSSADLQPGPYTLTNIPFINGAGEAVVVTTDALGRQVSTTVPFYVTSSLLQKGLDLGDQLIEMTIALFFRIDHRPLAVALEQVAVDLPHFGGAVDRGHIQHGDQAVGDMLVGVHQHLGTARAQHLEVHLVVVVEFVGQTQIPIAFRIVHAFFAHHQIDIALECAAIAV